MAIDWKQLLSDAQGYPDAYEVTVADGVKLTLGDLRGMNRSERTDLDRQIKEVKANQEKLDIATQQVAALYADIQAKQSAAPAPTKNADGGYNYDSDTYVGPVYKQLQDALAKQAQMEAKVQQAQQAAVGVFNMFANDLHRRQYDSYDAKARERLGDKFPSYDDAFKYAQSNRLLSQDGLTFNMSRAVREMVEPQILAMDRADLDKQRSDLVKQQQAAQQAANFPQRPGSVIRSSKLPKGEKPKSMDESFERAAQDPELMAQLNQLGQDNMGYLKPQ